MDDRVAGGTGAGEVVENYAIVIVGSSTNQVLVKRNRVAIWEFKTKFIHVILASAGVTNN